MFLETVHVDVCRLPVKNEPIDTSDFKRPAACNLLMRKVRSAES